MGMYMKYNSLVNSKKKYSNFSQVNSNVHIWELDLCSRPILSENGKSLWELTITDADKSFVFSEFFLSNNINSSSLEKVLKKLLSTKGVLYPNSCLYFRSQIENIISRALSRLNITAIPSRRCYGLTSLLKERMTTTLKENPGFTPGNNYSLTTNNPIIKNLPDALRGDRWAFVQLPYSVLIEETEKIFQGEIFGSCPKLKWIQKEMKSETVVPGVVVYSERAFPLAAWTNSHELAEISCDYENDCIMIDLGINQRWLYSRYRSSQAAKREAQEWEKYKRIAKGLHFLAVQSEDETGGSKACG